MGRNTVIVLLNDHLSRISDEKNLGRLLAAAVIGFRAEDPEESSQLCVPGMRVVSTDSSYDTQLIAVGGNQGRRVGVGHVDPARSSDLDILRALADQQGYRLVKKPRKP